MERHERPRSSSTLRPVENSRIPVISAGDSSLKIELIGKVIAEAEPMAAKLAEYVRYYEVRAANQLAYRLARLAENAGALDLHDAALRLEIASAPTSCTPTSMTLEADMAAISRALERLRLVRRSWWARAIRHAQSLRREVPRFPE
jgi:hypothetical protein